MAVPASVPHLPSPYYREVEFYRHQSQPLLAIASLLAAQQRDLLDMDGNAADLLLGQLYREYGLPGQAADSFQRASGTGVGSLRGKAWWELALQRYQRGDYARAQAALSRSTGLLPYELEQQRPLLQAQILMGLNRNAEAASLLSGWQPIQQQGPYERYNVGVALVRAGNLLEGAGMLDSVGTMAAPERELQAMRDQANLAMGYGFLRADHGATARPLFKRVQLDGPYSSLALLGAGWAELAPDGTRQQNLYLSPVGCVEDPTRVLPENMMVLRRPSRSACDRERTFKSRVFFEQAEAAATEAERYRRALVPWQVLVRRHPADAAVQEALLAVPYAYSQIKDRNQAIEHYRNAITQYETERKQLQQAMTLIRETRPADTTALTADQLAPAWNLPRREDYNYLGALLASDPFQATLRDLQAVRGLTRNLQPLDLRLAAVATRLDDAQAADARLADGEPLPATAGLNPTAATPTDTGPGKPITYFGVFDFVPPEAINRQPMGAPVHELPEQADRVVEDVLSSPVIAPRKPRRPRLDNKSTRERLARLQIQIQTLRKQIADAELAHERSLRQMALAELSSQQARLDTYLAQARFSLARLLDPALADHTGP